MKIEISSAKLLKFGVECKLGIAAERKDDEGTRYDIENMEYCLKNDRVSGKYVRVWIGGLVEFVEFDVPYAEKIDIGGTVVGTAVDSRFT